MNKERKDIIVNEIQLWKQNNMLPDQYCDFLLALYTEGDAPDVPSKKKEMDAGRIAGIFAVLLLTGLFLFVTYFTEIPFILQTAILAFFVGGILFVHFYYLRKVLSPSFILAIFAVLALLYTVKLQEAFFGNDRISLYVVLFLNCLSWLFGGLKKRVAFFWISGLVGIVIIITSMFI